MSRSGESRPWFTPSDREIGGGAAGFAVFLLAIGRFSIVTGIDTHAAPSTPALFAGVAAVLAAAALSAVVAALAGGVGRVGAWAVLGVGLVASAVLTLLRTWDWASGWLAVLVLAAGVVLLALAAWSGRSARRARAGGEARADVSP